MGEAQDGCVEAARGPIAPPAESAQAAVEEAAKGVKMDIARVGKKAPDFEASAFFDGAFKNIRLSDYFGKWIVLCFYPGDFTFV